MAKCTASMKRPLGLRELCSKFAHYAIPNFPKKSLIMLIIILFMLVIVFIMLIIQCTIKCCNVKLQVVYDNITHAMLYNYIIYYKVSML